MHWVFSWSCYRLHLQSSLCGTGEQNHSERRSHYHSPYQTYKNIGSVTLAKKHNYTSKGKSNILHGFIGAIKTPQNELGYIYLKSRGVSQGGEGYLTSIGDGSGVNQDAEKRLARKRLTQGGPKYT